MRLALLLACVTLSAQSGDTLYRVETENALSTRRRPRRYIGDWSSDVCSSDLSPRISGSVLLVSQSVSQGRRQSSRPVCGSRAIRCLAAKINTDSLPPETKRVGLA